MVNLNRCEVKMINATKHKGNTQAGTKLDKQRVGTTKLNRKHKRLDIETHTHITLNTQNN